MAQHFWKFHRNNPFEPEKGTFMQIMRCEHCDILVESPYGTNPEDYTQVICTGEKPRKPIPPKTKSAYQEKKDYPAKKKKRL